MAAIDQCTNCGSGYLRKLLTVVLDVPFAQRKITKEAISSKDIRIQSVDWGNEVWFCDTCNFVSLLEKKHEQGTTNNKPGNT